MGTRNLTVVKSNNKLKVAQYGQWDGYPSGQGQDIVDFLLGDRNLEKLKENLSKVRYLDEKGKDKEFLEEYNRRAPKWSNEPDNRTDEEKSWWNTFMTRDLGAEILTNIADSNLDEIIIENSFVFGNDSLFCEWAYVVDLDDDLLYVYEGFNTEEVTTGLWKHVPEPKESASGDTYYPVKPIAKMSIDSDTLKESWEKFLNNYRDDDNE